jgi:DNA-binding response OmpR family regulator
MSNALKFTDQGNTVGIELKQKENDAIIRVWDNGIGIDPKYFTNLFNNFFQVNDERAKNTGYGIGLALSKSIIELHGGTIEVSSKIRKIGHGGFTVFTIKLPALTTQNRSAVASNEKPVVLVVEDNNDLRKFIVDALKPNYSIIEASDGKEGLDIAIESIPDLIISDIMMPVMDGLELCTSIKKGKTTSHIPILLLTAKATIDDQIKGLEYNADAYITKPFDLRLLITQINNLLHNRSLLQEIFRNHYLQVEPTASENTTTIESDPFLQKMVDQIQLELENTEFSVATLAKKMAVSQPVLYRKVHALTGLSVNEFIKSLRMKKASELLSSKAHNVSEVAYMVGFADRKYFSKEFKKHFGKNPSDY